jgi:Phospholipase_D-nuclease N-terminal
MVVTAGAQANVVVLALIPIIIVGLAFDVFCLVDLYRMKAVAYLPKWAWALVICIVSAPLGGALYLLLGRRH